MIINFSRSSFLVAIVISVQLPMPAIPLKKVVRSQTSRNETSCDHCQMIFHWDQAAGIADSTAKICVVTMVARAWNCSLYTSSPHVLLTKHHNKNKAVPGDRWGKYYSLVGPWKRGEEEKHQKQKTHLKKTQIYISSINDTSNRLRQTTCKSNHLNVVHFYPKPAVGHANNHWFWMGSDNPRLRITKYLHTNYTKTSWGPDCYGDFSPFVSRCAHRNLQELIGNMSYISVHIRRDDRSGQYPRNCSEPWNVVRVILKHFRGLSDNWTDVDTALVATQERDAGYRAELVEAFRQQGVSRVVFGDMFRTEGDKDDMYFRWMCIKKALSQTPYTFNFHPSFMHLEDPAVCPPCPTPQPAFTLRPKPRAHTCSGAYETRCTNCSEACLARWCYKEYIAAKGHKKKRASSKATNTSGVESQSKKSKKRRKKK